MSDILTEDDADSMRDLADRNLRAAATAERIADANPDQAVNLQMLSLLAKLVADVAVRIADKVDPGGAEP